MARLKLDPRDIRILAILAREGRITKAELASRVALSPAACWDRLRRLERSGLIRGYHADLALGRIAPHITVFVTIELASHRAESFQAFEAAIARHPEITACWAVGGGIDYLMQVVTRDMASYQALIDALLESRAGVGRYFTYVVTKEVAAAGAPPLAMLAEESPEDPTD